MLLIGRKAVLEALHQPALVVKRVTMATSARGVEVDAIAEVAERTGVLLERVNARKVDRLAGDDRQHQGVAAQVETPAPIALDSFLADRTGRRWATNLLVLDHVHNPANVGMILRTAAAAGIDGVVLPRQGTAPVGPLAVKAGSGMVYAVPHLDTATMDDAILALQTAQVALVGLDAHGTNLFEADCGDRVAWILGNESAGLSATTIAALDQKVSLPLDNGVESLNVAAAAAVLSYELVRRR